MFDSHSDIGAVVYGPHDDPDQVLCEFAIGLLQSGYRPVGLIQLGCRGDASQSRVRAITLPNCEGIDLRHNGAPFSAGCGLNTADLTTTRMQLARAVNEGADLVIINRFGKLEAKAMGFIGEIRQAAAADVPLLIAVAEERFMAWTCFTKGMGIKLRCAREPLEAWWRTVSRHSRNYSARPALTYCEVAK
jgi:hypothetical protein